MNRELRGEDRLTRPTPTIDPQRKHGDEDGPTRPDVERPNTKNILDRMKRVDPNQAKKYRQRSGE
jgi:hypothetical protein